MTLESLLKHYSKEIVKSLKDLYIKSYLEGAKRVASKEQKESLYDEAYDYFQEQQDWLESHFVDTDSAVLHAKLSTAIAEGQNFGEFWGNVKDSGMFERQRAERIFRTEMNRAFSEGTIRQYLKEGVKEVNILLGPSPCPICIDMAMSGPHLTKDIQGAYPLHPNCSCVIVNAAVSKPGGK